MHKEEWDELEEGMIKIDECDITADFDYFIVAFPTRTIIKNMRFGILRPYLTEDVRKSKKN